MTAFSFHTAVRNYEKYNSHSKPLAFLNLISWFILCEKEFSCDMCVHLNHISFLALIILSTVRVDILWCLHFQGLWSRFTAVGMCNKNRSLFYDPLTWFCTVKVEIKVGINISVAVEQKKRAFICWLFSVLCVEFLPHFLLPSDC